MDCRSFLGVDLGSGSVKVVLVAADGLPIGSESAQYDTDYPTPGSVEQNPDDWYTATCTAVRRLLDRYPVADKIEAIGLSGTSHAPILLDKHNRWVRPAILWNDRRSEAQVHGLEQEFGESIAHKTKNTVSCTWSLPQIRWVRENESDHFRKVKRVLFTKDYLGYRLTGELASDVTSAYSSLLVEAQTMHWDRALVELAGLEEAELPPILSCTDTVGRLTEEAAHDLGLSTRVRVVAGAIDSAAELIGVGATDQQTAVIRLGSAGGVMTINDRAVLVNGCLLYPHLVKPLWYYQAGTNSATTSLNWVIRLFGLSDYGNGYQTVDDIVRASPIGSDGLLFHPYLLGERAPYWSRNLKGGYNGIGINHDRAHFVRAVMEGVAFSLKDGAGLLGWHNVAEVRICGGGSKSLAWCQIISNVLGLPVSTMQEPDASPLGAALMAMAATTSTDLSDCAKRATKPKVYIEPEHANYDTYQESYAQYQRLSQSLLELYENRR